MVYAKISSNNTVLKFPYNILDLSAENNNTQYDDRHSLPEWYSMTEEALSNNYSVVEVTEQDVLASGINLAISNISQKQIPELVDNTWVLGWNSIAKTQEELDDIEVGKENIRLTSST